MSKHKNRKGSHKRKKPKEEKRLLGRNHHHLKPKARGGKSNPNNLLLIKIERHRCWHEIFGNRTLHEVIKLLERIEEAKRRQR
jgi:hypothetical protein